MPTSYDDAYEHLKEAQAKFGELATHQGRPDRYACLRVGFYHLYQAANVAAMCHEASGNAVGGAQGGSFGRTRDEAATFLHASRNCHALLDQDDAALAASCRQWLERAKAFVERTRAQEARVTNLQYARMPEQQDPSIVCKDGRSWKR